MTGSEATPLEVDVRSLSDDDLEREMRDLNNLWELQSSREGLERISALALEYAGRWY